jgi:hypothetical protein
LSFGTCRKILKDIHLFPYKICVARNKIRNYHHKWIFLFDTVRIWEFSPMWTDFDKCHNLSKWNVKLILKILSDLDFFKGLVEQKNVVFNSYCQSISPDSFINVFENMKRRLWLCVDHNGEHFEQFLWQLIFWLWTNLNVLNIARKDTSSQLTKNLKIITFALFLQKPSKQRIVENNSF